MATITAPMIVAKSKTISIDSARHLP